MKRTIIALVLSVAGMQWISAQTVTRQSNGNTNLHRTLNEAVSASTSGDTIYLSGDIFNVGDLSLPHKLAIIGAGHNPTECAATGTTRINGNLYLTGAADESYLSGFILNGTFFFNRTGDNINNNSTIERVYFNGNITLQRWEEPQKVNNLQFRENILAGYFNMGSLIYNALLEKNISNGTFDGFVDSQFSNNAFLNDDQYAGLLSNSTNCLLNNNIFMRQYDNGYKWSGSNNLTFKNNLFVGPSLNIDGSNFDGGGNILSEPAANIFVNQSGTAFNYAHDYHLKPGCRGINAGTNGKDIGLYGTTIPYKTNLLPKNPHISVSNIASETDSEGKLQIHIEVSAQDL